MAEQDRADAPDTGRADGGTATAESSAAAAGAGTQSIESTTAALGDMEPSAGSGEAIKAETADDKT